MPENKQKLTFTNKLILIILPIIVILFCCYNISTSNLICSSYSGCKIVEQNLFRYTMKEKRVNLDSISKFYVSSSIDVMKLWNYFNASSSDQARIKRKEILKYHIYALTKNGEKQKFFSASSHNRYKAENIAKELNDFLNSSDKNINIKY